MASMTLAALPLLSLALFASAVLAPAALGISGHVDHRADRGCDEHDDDDGPYQDRAVKLLNRLRSGNYRCHGSSTHAGTRSTPRSVR